MAFLIGRRLLGSRLLNQTPRRHGYIVLVPEIGEDLPEKNPLLQDDGLPQFNNVTIENCMAAIGKQTLDFESEIRRIEEDAVKTPDADPFDLVINPLEKIGTGLDLTWGVSKTLYLGNSSLMPTKSYMAIHDRAKRARATKYNSQVIFRAAQSGLEGQRDLSAEEKRVLQKYQLEGRLNGLYLDGATKTILDADLPKMMMERMRFKTKLDAITKKFAQKITDPQIMRDFPTNVADAMSISPTGVDGPWMVTLQPQISQPFMEYCPVREMRWNLWSANVSRCSGYGEREYETSTVIEELRFLRRNQARILGFDSYADMSMETKMAGSVENVQNMFQALLTQAKPAQDKELSDLLSFAQDRGFTGERIELWDVDYWMRKQCKALYDYDENKIQEYFPLGKVLTGLFELVEMLFNIRIKQRANISTWHKDVKYYDVFETHSSAPVAGFYFDPYARSDTVGRQNNGWMVGVQSHSQIAGTKPIAALVFNFQPASNDVPSLLTFKDIHVLFHKFGQALQHMLTRTTYSEVSGLSNIEWDAVEVSGHVLSSWLYNKSTIDRISSHYLSEDKLPVYMFDSLVNTRKHGAGTSLCKELYLGALDLEIYSSKTFWLDIVKRLWPEYRSFPLEKIDSHTCNFSQIFYEEWAAAYFSHVWSRMIAADVYSAFHEVRNQEQQVIDVGKRFRDTYLALGGSCHPNEVFRNFRGRDPSPKALLATLGLKNKDNQSVE